MFLVVALLMLFACSNDDDVQAPFCVQMNAAAFAE